LGKFLEIKYFLVQKCKIQFKIGGVYVIFKKFGAKNDLIFPCKKLKLLFSFTVDCAALF